MKMLLIVTALLGMGFLTVGCETHHEESDHDTVFGGHKHEETTTTRNPVTGDTSTSHTEQTTH